MRSEALLCRVAAGERAAGRGVETTSGLAVAAFAAFAAIFVVFIRAMGFSIGAGSDSCRCTLARKMGQGNEGGTRAMGFRTGSAYRNGAT
jgi:hypothetical protein